MVASTAQETVGRRSWIRMRARGKRREEILFNPWKFYPVKALEHRPFRAIAAPALRGRILDIVGSALDLPVRSGAADSVLCNEVLEHLPDPVGAGREIHRVLLPGGRGFTCCGSNRSGGSFPVWPPASRRSGPTSKGNSSSCRGGFGRSRRRTASCRSTDSCMRWPRCST